MNSISEYRLLRSRIQQLKNTDAFKVEVRLKVMSESEDFSTISSSIFINWDSDSSCDIFIFYLWLDFFALEKRVEDKPAEKHLFSTIWHVRHSN